MARESTLGSSLARVPMTGLTGLARQTTNWIGLDWTGDWARELGPDLTWTGSNYRTPVRFRRKYQSGSSQ
jgi:hypothetical protein